MDYFELAVDLKREEYCYRQTAGGVCVSKSQCLMCYLYQEMELPARFPVPAKFYCVIIMEDFVLIEGYEFNDVFFIEKERR